MTSQRQEKEADRIAIRELRELRKEKSCNNISGFGTGLGKKGKATT